MRVPAVRFARFYRRRRDDVGRGRRGYAGFPARGARRDAGGGDRRVHLNHARARAAPRSLEAADGADGDGAADGAEEETREPLLDENGVPVVDAEGNPVYAGTDPAAAAPASAHLAPVPHPVWAVRSGVDGADGDAEEARGGRFAPPARAEGGDREGGRRRQV